MSDESTSSNETDLPAMHRHERGDSSVRDNKGTVATGGSATINDRTALYISILALALAGMAMGYEMSQSSSRTEMRQLQDQAIDARIAAAVERSRGDMQSQLAQAQAVANLYRTEALLTKTNVEALYTKLNVKGVNVGTPDGH